MPGVQFYRLLAAMGARSKRPVGHWLPNGRGF